MEKYVQAEKKRPYTKHGSPGVDEDLKKIIDQAQLHLQESLEPFIIQNLNPFQRKQVYYHFEKTKEYKIKTYREEDHITLKVYPVGKLKRLAEQKTQEVLMKKTSEALPPMGSYERFIIHDYLKDRDGIKTESKGEKGKDRHIIIIPVFGRTPKKAKNKRLIR